MACSAKSRFPVLSLILPGLLVRFSGLLVRHSGLAARFPGLLVRLSGLAALLLIVGCSGPKDIYSQLRNADLVFVRSGGSAMDDAISDATASPDGRGDFAHVAIVQRQDDSLFVIEALPMRGVIRRPFAEFAAENGDSLLCFRRPDPAVIRDIAGRQGVGEDMLLWAFVQRALSRLGEGYDYIYLPNNGLCYCSELIYDSYIDTAPSPGDCHLFCSAPMNFLAPDGTLPDFWKELFELMQSPVPQGVNGTNPNDMFRDPILVDVPGL